MKIVVLNLIILNFLSFFLYAKPITKKWIAKYPGDSAGYAVVCWGTENIGKDSLGFTYVIVDTSLGFGFSKYTPDGNRLFSTYQMPSGYNGAGVVNSVVKPNGDVYISGGVSTDLLGWIYTAKFNSNGVFLWGKLYNPDYDDEAGDMKMDNDGNIIIVGIDSIQP